MVAKLQVTLASNIDEVILELDRVIVWSIQENSRLGYFAALYKRVTERVKWGVENGRFIEPKLVEKLDVVFANRYLKALGDYFEGNEVSKVWKLAFKTAEMKTPIVLEHLMLGMNAHINIDLGIAAVQTAPGTKLLEIKNDFRIINKILSSMVNEVQQQLASIWPAFKWIDSLAGDSDEYIAELSMEVARDNAWNLAVKLAQMNPISQKEEIQALDEKFSKMGEELLAQGFGLRFLLMVIRLTEKGSVADKIRVLNS